MEQVLKLWLNLNYDDEKHGMPTWRKVVEAADKRSAGNNHALAKAIAADHPLDSKITHAFTLIAGLSLLAWYPLVG